MNPIYAALACAALIVCMAFALSFGARYVTKGRWSYFMHPLELLAVTVVVCWGVYEATSVVQKRVEEACAQQASSPFDAASTLRCPEPKAS